MAEFEEAYHPMTKKFIAISDYKDIVHYKKIQCPECMLAPIHIVRKQKAIYFASNRRNEHTIDCQHFRETIPNKILIRLVNSSKIEDKQRLNFLIENNLNSALQILLNRNDNKLSQKPMNNGIKSNSKKIKLTYKKESIPRVHLKNIFKKKTEYINNFLLIYGIANIQSNNYERTNFKTGEKFNVKNLTFRDVDKFRFSISLTSYQSNQYKESQTNNVKFAVFGKLSESNGFLKLTIISIDHLNYLQ